MIKPPLPFYGHIIHPLISAVKYVRFMGLILFYTGLTKQKAKEILIMILVALAAAVFLAVPIEMFISYVDRHH